MRVARTGTDDVAVRVGNAGGHIRGCLLNEQKKGKQFRNTVRPLAQCLGESITSPTVPSDHLFVCGTAPTSLAEARCQRCTRCPPHPRPAPPTARLTPPTRRAPPTPHPIHVPPTAHPTPPTTRPISASYLGAAAEEAVAVVDDGAGAVEAGARNEHGERHDDVALVGREVVGADHERRAGPRVVGHVARRDQRALDLPKDAIQQTRRVGSRVGRDGVRDSAKERGPDGAASGRQGYGSDLRRQGSGNALGMARLWGEQTAKEAGACPPHRSQPPRPTGPTGHTRPAHLVLRADSPVGRLARRPRHPPPRVTRPSPTSHAASRDTRRTLR